MKPNIPTNNIAYPIIAPTTPPKPAVAVPIPSVPGEVAAVRRLSAPFITNSPPIATNPHIIVSKISPFHITS